MSKNLLPLDLRSQSGGGDTTSRRDRHEVYHAMFPPSTSPWKEFDMTIPFAKLTLRQKTAAMLGPRGGTGSPVFEQGGDQARIRRAPVRAIAMYHRVDADPWRALWTGPKPWATGVLVAHRSDDHAGHAVADDHHGSWARPIAPAPRFEGAWSVSQSTRGVRLTGWSLWPRPPERKRRSNGFTLTQTREPSVEEQDAWT